MVHKAFREALGETATQAGSENAPGRFRFDFSATGAVPVSVMQDVEARVNDLVLADLGVHAEIMSQEEAVRSGAMALFGEKYGDQVRVVSVGDWARELCGGTHAGRSGQLGVIKLLGESSIGSGVRRVEALVGADAYRFLAREHVLVAQLSEALKARPEELPERVNDIVERLRAAEKALEQTRIAPAAVAGRPARGRRGRRQRRQADQPAGRRRRRGRHPHDGAQPAQPGQPGAARRGGADRRQGRQGLRRRRDQRPARATAGVKANDVLARGDAAGRWPRGRQGRRRPGRRHRRVADRRGARRPRAPRIAAGAAAGLRPEMRPRRTPRDRPRRRPDRGRDAATRPGSWRPRWRRYAAARATSARIARLVREEEAVEVVVGLPRSLSGGEGPAAVEGPGVRARGWPRGSRRSPVRLQDERLTTVSAEAMLRDRGRRVPQRRAVVDQAAAVLILQHALDTERATGRPPGEIVRGETVTGES